MAQPTTADELRAKPPQPGIDPNVSIPKAVRDAGKRSEVIQQALTGQAEPSVVAPPAPNGAEPPPAPPPGEAAPPQGTAPSTPPQPAAGQTPPSESDDNVSIDEWKRRFHSMKGRYDRLAEQVGVMGEQVNRLQTENATLRSQPPQSQPIPTGSLITQQEVDDYGPEFVDMVRRAAAEIAQPLQDEVRTLRSQLGHVQGEAGNSFLTRMHATIGGLVPNWQDLNRDPRFIEWVALPEVYSGVIRQQLMQDAWNSGDANRVAAFFRAYLAEVAAVDPQGFSARAAPSPPPASAPGMPAAVPGVTLGTRLSLDQLAAPGRAQSSAQMPTDKPVYTAQDITRFYTEVAAGKWRTREADRAAIDADIIAAQHEGRIIPDQRTVRPMDWNGNR